MKPLTERSEPLGPMSDPTMLEEQICRRAYEIYEARGREHGHDREDWLQAEAEIVRSREMAESDAGTSTRETKEARAPQAATAA